MPALGDELAGVFEPGARHQDAARQDADRAFDDAHVLVGDQDVDAGVAQQRLRIGDQDEIVGPQ